MYILIIIYNSIQKNIKITEHNDEKEKWGNVIMKNQGYIKREKKMCFRKIQKNITKYKKREIKKKRNKKKRNKKKDKNKKYTK